MDYIKNIYQYFTSSEQIDTTDYQFLELEDFNEKNDKYYKVRELVISNDIIDYVDPIFLYKDNGIIDLDLTKQFYGNYIKNYYYYNIKDFQIQDIFNNFYIIRGDEVVLKYKT